MGNLFSLFRGRTKPSPDPDHDLDSWSDALCSRIAQHGFEAIFKSELTSIASAADSNPALLPAYIQKWMKADKTLAPLVANKDLSSLSKLDYKTGTRADGETQRDRVPDDPIPGVVESDDTPVKVYHNELFQNWGGTVSYTPAYTFVPKTEVGVVNIVKFAVREGRRVRCGGTRHSWSEVYGGEDAERPRDVFISMVEPAAAAPASKFWKSAANPPDTELESIQFDGTFTGEDGKEHGRVRLGGACTSEHFRKWALSQEGGDWQWMIHALPILVSITSAGWTQVICHGSGIDHQSVSDLCVEMRIVNCKGELQVITDKEQLKAVAGGFGLMGVITSHVFAVDPLKVARLFPLRVPTPLAVPPVDRADVPEQDDFNIADYTDDELAAATATFEADCKRFYSEWFWFPFHSECWVNCWDTEEPGEDRPQYPDPKEVRLQNLQLALSRLFEVTFLGLLGPETQARLLGFAAMQLLPSGELLRTSVPDALHFQRGIHRMPVKDFELSIEIPAKEDGQPDFSICQKAWWEAISEVYESLPDAPMRTTLEMRIVGDSETTMSTQRGNKHSTCMIEVLTNTLVSEEEWNAFIEKVMARWASLKNPLTNKPLRVKPHWAKEWPRRIRGMNIQDYLKWAYEEDIPEFKQQLQSASEAGDYNLQDALRVFGNDTILDIIGESV